MCLMYDQCSQISTIPFISSLWHLSLPPSFLPSAVAHPAITGQPAPHLSVIPGQTISFAVIATGDNLMYQWQKDGVNITEGASEAAYIIQSVTESDEGEYQCVVSNPAGMATSNTAQLTVGKHNSRWSASV